MSNITSNQTKITDFSTQVPDQIQRSKICSALFSAVTRTSPYTLAKPESKELLFQMAQIGFDYKTQNPLAK